MAQDHLPPPHRRRSFVEAQYPAWVRCNTPRPGDLRRMRAEAGRFAYKPLVSVVLPVYDPEQEWLEAALDSVVRQVYPNWELCVRDDASTRPHVQEVLDRYGRLDGRIKITHGTENRGICGASNAALSTATGEFVGLLDHDDELAPHAIFEVVKLLQERPDADLVYSDEDMMDAAGNRYGPRFKPDWSPETLLALNYVIHFSTYRRSLLEEIGGFREGFEGAQDYDLLLRFTEKTDKIHHIPKILYHWKAVEGSTAADVEAKPQTHERTLQAVTEALARRNLAGRVEDEFYYSTVRARLDVPEDLLVSIIIPAWGDLSLLRACLESIEPRTEHPRYEILVADNDPATAWLVVDIWHQFVAAGENSSLADRNNLGAARANGEYLLFLHDDTEVLDGGWMGALLEHARRPEVGAVGARLRYGDGRLQHAGLVLGAGAQGIAAPSHRFYPEDYPGYLGATLLPRNFSAVSGACLMVRKEVFEEAGGFDGENLMSAYHDVDLCLRIGEKGRRVVYTPYAELLHHGREERQEPDPEDIRYVKERWGEVLARDPFYNPNFSLYDGSYNLRADALQPRVLREGSHPRASRRGASAPRRG